MALFTALSTMGSIAWFPIEVKERMAVARSSRWWAVHIAMISVANCVWTIYNKDRGFGRLPQVDEKKVGICGSMTKKPAWSWR